MQATDLSMLAPRHREQLANAKHLAWNPNSDIS